MGNQCIKDRNTARDAEERSRRSRVQNSGAGAKRAECREGRGCRDRRVGVHPEEPSSRAEQQALLQPGRTESAFQTDCSRNSDGDYLEEKKIEVVKLHS